MNDRSHLTAALGLAALLAGCSVARPPADVSATGPDADVTPDTATPGDVAPTDGGADDDTAAPGDGLATDATNVSDVPDALGPLAIALDDLCEPLAASACQLYVGCRAATSASSVAACRDHAAETCEASLAAVRQRVAAGAIRYDADAAYACLTRLGLVACGPPDAMLAQVADACHDVLIGQLTASAPCADAGDCAPDLFCAPDAGGACPGTAPPRQPPARLATRSTRHAATARSASSAAARPTRWSSTPRVSPARSARRAPSATTRVRPRAATCAAPPAPPARTTRPAPRASSA